MDPPPASPVVKMNPETEGEQRKLTTPQILLRIALAGIAFVSFKTWVWRQVAGLYLYFVEFIRAALGNDGLDTVCTGVKSVRDPWNNLNDNDWFRFQRCLGNEDGYERQGELLLVFYDTFIYVLNFSSILGPLPTLVVILVFSFKILPWMFNMIENLWLTFLSAPQDVLARIFSVSVLIFTSGLYIFASTKTFLLVLGMLFFGVFIIVLRNTFVDNPGAAWVGALRMTSPMVEWMGWTIHGLLLFLQRIYALINNVAQAWANLGRCYHVETCACMNEQNQRYEFLEQTFRTDHASLNQMIQNRDAQITNLTGTIRHLEEEIHRQRESIRLSARPHDLAGIDSPNVLVSSGSGTPLDRAARKIELLETELVNLSSDRNTQKIAMDRTIKNLESQLRYLREDGNSILVREELAEAKRKLKVQDTHIAEVSLKNMKLRQELDYEKNNYSLKCKDEAECSRKIRKLEEDRAKLIHFHEENDLMVQDAAREFGKTGDEARHYTVRRYLQEITQAMTRIIGDNGLIKNKELSKAIFAGMDSANLRRANEINARLELELDRLGGDVQAVRLGINQARPPPIRELTFEEYAKLVFTHYVEVYRNVKYLDGLLADQKAANVPEWRPDPPQNDMINQDAYVISDWGNFATTTVVQSFRFRDYECLLQSVLRGGIGRLINRGIELRAFIKHLPRTEGAFYSDSVENPLETAGLAFRNATMHVLDDLRELQKRQSSIEDSKLVATEKRRYAIWGAFHLAIKALTAAIKSFHAIPPNWVRNPNFLMPPFTEKTSFQILAATLVKFEINELEYRVDQLLKFMKDSKLPGTEHGQPRLAGPPSYQEDFDALTAAMHYALLVKDHWDEEMHHTAPKRIRLPLDHPPLIHAVKREKGPIVVPPATNFPWKISYKGELKPASILATKDPFNPNAVREQVFVEDGIAKVEYHMPHGDELDEFIAMSVMNEKGHLIYGDHDTELKWYNLHYQRARQLNNYLRESGAPEKVGVFEWKHDKVADEKIDEGEEEISERQDCGARSLAAKQGRACASVDPERGVVFPLIYFQIAGLNSAELRANGKDAGEAFLCINDLLPPINHAVKRTKERIKSGEIDDETCTSLIPIHRGVERTLKELGAILKKFTPEEGASKLEVFWKAGRSIFQEKKAKGILQRLHEYVGVLTLSHAEAADAGNMSLTEKDNIQEILANISRSTTAQAAFLPRKCRNLLSLDGGGLRGLSILYILQNLMAKVNVNQDPPLKPCEVFDLIGGSGTGGLIAIMLGRLGMTVDECLKEYLDLFERLSTEHAGATDMESGSSPIIKAGILRATVLELVEARGLEPTSMLRNDDNVSCYTFVCATAKINNTIVHFQNYLLPGEPDRTPATIVDAACATLSSAKIFEVVEFGRPTSKYVAGDLGANNPIDRVWNEAQRIWSKTGGLEQLVSCVTSVGAGSPQLRAIHTDGPGFTDAMYDIATQTEEIAKKFRLGKRELGGRDKRYHRFNINNLPELGWERYSDSEVIRFKAIDYLERYEEEIEQCAEHLQRENFVPNNAQETQKYYDVPRKLVRNFIGREETLSKIDYYFSIADVTCPKVLILHALGGQGKSQIALKYCQKSKESHQGIFWINASSEITTREAFERIATVLDGKSPTGLGDLDQKIQHILRTLERWETRWILVFDNYDSPEVFDVRSFFPRSGPGEILITSRNQNLGRFGERLEVPAMTSDEGLKLLLPDPTKRERIKDEGIRIVDRLGGLPLAIDQAAAYIDDIGMAIEDFLPTYEKERQRILGYTPDYGWEYRTMQLDGKTEKDKALSAFTTWNMSFQRLFLNDSEKQKRAAHFLTVHAFLDHLNVAEDLFRTFWEVKPSPPEWLTIFVGPTEEDSDSDSPSSEHDFSSDDDSLARSHWSDRQSRRPSPSNDTVQKGSKSHSKDTRTKNEWKSNLFIDLRVKCCHLSLLRVQSDDDHPDRKHQIFSLHPLIRDWLQLQVKKNERRSYFQEAIGIVSVFIQSFESRNTTADQKKALLANIDACISNDKRFLTSGKAFRYIDSDRDDEEGARPGASGHANDYRVLGQKHPDTLTSIANLALTYWNQGRWKEAEELNLQVIETRKRVLGQEHPDTLATIANLASTYRNQGRLKEAEELDLAGYRDDEEGARPGASGHAG
ncbi:hypothetical protein G7Y89_g6995 [Cudoniella acicularis]|uniref:PNPLA domain-containing protein n=1 Tax=Cudoniella acicularis TaxID=354080 RepID=A0A8H4RL87_9HELO|nr:hypothetical protein G7Y89_g6995 [Cudoniella acicularis]